MKVDDFYSSYNARHLKPSEVAESFVWSESFGKLIQNNHTVVLGARGCGKTTLMKMLTLPALNSWRSARASSIIKDIPFFAIYISTDIYWDVKNQTYSSQLSKFGNFSEIISFFAVTTNVFTSLCDTFINILHYEIMSVDEDKEQELCKVLIEAWKLSAVIPRLRFIKDALNKRIDEVNQLIQNLILNFDESNVPHYDYFNLSFESSIEYIIPIFERIYSIESEKKWALCFDELEFAPLWLQEKLFTSLRSRKQYILYKLSSSPILSSDLEMSLKKAYSASAGNDLVTIKMWQNTDNEKFSRNIIDSLLFNKFGHKNSSEFFGSNKIYNKEKDSYIEESSFHKELVELYSKDESFETFLKAKAIDIDNLHLTDSKKKDTLYRKIKPIVYFRNYYIANNKFNNYSRPTLRSRKTSDLFSGVEVLSRICDGNPRWLIGVISSILSKSTNLGANLAIQYDEILNASNRFRNVINNIPIGLNNSISLAEIVDKVGNFFYDQILGSNFYMDPKGTIEIDSSEVDIPENIIDMLKKGVSQGAFILLDSQDGSFDFEIRKRRIKLSFLFFPLYKLPLRNYPSVKLSDCLKENSVNDSGQLQLF